MMALILLAMWTWDRPLVDCAGQPEALAHYWMMATVRKYSPFAGVCTDDTGAHTFACPAFIPGPPVPFVQIPDPGVGATASTTVDPVGDPSVLPLPPVGSLSAWPWPSQENPGAIAAHDTAGNKSGDPCP